MFLCQWCLVVVVIADILSLVNGWRRKLKKNSFSHKDILTFTRILRNVFIGKGNCYSNRRMIHMAEKNKKFLCPNYSINVYEEISWHKKSLTIRLLTKNNSSPWHHRKEHRFQAYGHHHHHHLSSIVSHHFHHHSYIPHLSKHLKVVIIMIIVDTYIFWIIHYHKTSKCK